MSIFGYSDLKARDYSSHQPVTKKIREIEKEEIDKARAKDDTIHEKDEEITMLRNLLKKELIKV